MEIWIWLILAVVFLIAEAATVTMTSLWFAGGCLAALIVAATGGGWGFQVAVCLAVSAGLLACLRPIAKKHFTPKLHRTNVDAVIGSQGYVTADIDNISATGTVKLGAMEWTARSATGDPISKGTLVQVEKIEGVKALVTPVRNSVEV
jgi:membrane protein implicated in regulation of membrane protease activity